MVLRIKLRALHMLGRSSPLSHILPRLSLENKAGSRQEEGFAEGHYQSNLDLIKVDTQKKSRQVRLSEMKLTRPTDQQRWVINDEC